MEHLGGDGAHAGDQLGECEHAPLHQLGVGDREGRLQPDDTEGSVVERRVLFVVGVRGMVGGDAVDDAVLEGAAQRGDIGCFAQRRVHLRVRVVVLARVIGERKVVRRHLRGHAAPPLFRPAEQVDGAAGRHVAEVHPATRQLGEDDVAGHHDLLGRGRDPFQTEPRRDQPLVHHPARSERRLLAVVGDRDVERARVLERRAHQVSGDDRLAVVGHGHRPRPHHLAEFGELFALLAHRHRADRIDAGQARAHRLPDDEPDRRLVVGHRVSVRHRAHGREPARHGRAGARRHRLLVLVAGLAQVHVHVHQSRGDDLPRHVPHVGLGSRQPRPDACDLAVLEEEVGSLVEATARIDHPAAAQHQRSHQCIPPASRWAASASSGRPPASR